MAEEFSTIPTTYRVKDLVDEPIDGTFYHQELKLVRVEQDKVYTLERVLKKRKRGENIGYFVTIEGIKKNKSMCDALIRHGSIVYQTNKKQFPDHLPRKKNIFVRYKTAIRNSPHVMMGDSWFNIEEWVSNFTVDATNVENFENVHKVV